MLILGFLFQKKGEKPEISTKIACGNLSTGYFYSNLFLYVFNGFCFFRLVDKGLICYNNRVVFNNERKVRL